MPLDAIRVSSKKKEKILSEKKFCSSKSSPYTIYLPSPVSRLCKMTNATKATLVQCCPYFICLWFRWIFSLHIGKAPTYFSHLSSARFRSFYHVGICKGCVHSIARGYLCRSSIQCVRIVGIFRYQHSFLFDSKTIANETQEYRETCSSTLIPSEELQQLCSWIRPDSFLGTYLILCQKGWWCWGLSVPSRGTSIFKYWRPKCFDTLPSSLF